MFDERLKQLREEKGKNMRQVANELGIPYTTYVSYEKNEREPNSEMLIKIAIYFDCSVDYLIGISNSKELIEPYILENTKKAPPDQWESLKAELMQLPDSAIDDLYKYIKYLLWLEEQDWFLALSFVAATLWFV